MYFQLHFLLMLAIKLYSFIVIFSETLLCFWLEKAFDFHETLNSEVFR